MHSTEAKMLPQQFDNDNILVRPPKLLKNTPVKHLTPRIEEDLD